MVEKEERIAVAKMIVNIDNDGSTKLDHFKIYSRQDAIERIKNADIKKHLKCQKEGRRPTDNERYSAILNALLEDK